MINKKAISIIPIIFIGIILIGCDGPAKRNKWQKEMDFSKRRNVYYNEFVSSGGMIRDDSDETTNTWKKEIQQAINQGRVNQK